MRFLGEVCAANEGGRADERAPRLLLVLDSLDVGGAECHVVDLAIALRRKGHEVTVACSVVGELSRLLQESDVPVRPLLGRLVKRRFSIAFAGKLRKLIKGGGFDLVHTHMYASATAPLGQDVSLVITEHSEGAWRLQPLFPRSVSL